jgi:hypothetical protein
MGEGRERRSDGRIALQVFVDEGTAQGSGGLSRAVNLSRTGMYLLRVPGNGNRAPARFAWLGFHLPDGGEPIRALVEVVHTRRFGSLEAAGVRFKYLFPTHRRRLHDYLACSEAT